MTSNQTHIPPLQYSPIDVNKIISPTNQNTIKSSTSLDDHEKLDCYTSHKQLSSSLQFPILSSFYKPNDSTSISNPMLSVNNHSTIFSQKYPSISSTNGINNLTSLDTKNFDHLISQ